MPFECRHQMRPSPSAEKILGAERSPKGRAVSMYTDSFQRIPSNGRSSGDTGTALYASLRSTFASRVPRPNFWMMLTASSIDAYLIEHSAGSTPSFTLEPSGEDRSTTRRHLLGRFRFGITPIGLIHRLGRACAAVGWSRTTRLKSTSWAR